MVGDKIRTTITGVDGMLRGDTSGVEAEAKTVAALTAAGLAATTAFRHDRDGDADASTAACLVASKHYDRIRFWAVFS